jgi:uncharacterized protein
MSGWIRPFPDRALIGMIHLPALPGSPAAAHGLPLIVEMACQDARILADAGFDALVVENFGDIPFQATRVDPVTVACMTVVVRAVRQAVPLPLGVNVLRNDATAALAIATVCDAAFVRINVHTGVYATDQGIIEGRADQTLRYRSRLSGGGSRAAGRPPDVAILADVHVKHAQPMSAPGIVQAAEEAAYRGMADGLIVSGPGTGRPTAIDDLKAVRSAVPDRPMYVGSGATIETLDELLHQANGVIVGTALKRDGRTREPVDAARAQAFVRAAGR